jgi:hypothetical protein
MKRPNGSPHIYLASSGEGIKPVVDSSRQLRSVLETLEECQCVLTETVGPDAARLLAVAILELRMRLHRIGDSELKELCNALTAGEDKPDYLKSLTGVVS